MTKSERNALILSMTCLTASDWSVVRRREGVVEGFKEQIKIVQYTNVKSSVISVFTVL